MSAPALTFLAPAFGDAAGEDRFDDRFDSPAAPVIPMHRSVSPARPGKPAGGLRMTRGAREAATGMNVTDEEIQRCLDQADDVTPDPNHAGRTHFRRGRLTVIAGADGMVLRVNLARRAR